MADAPSLRWLLRRSVIAAAVATVLFLVCFYFIDRPVAFFVHAHELNKTPGLVWLTYPPPILQAWAPALLVLLAVRRAFGPLKPWQRALVAAGVGIIVADQFRESLSFVFARYWPETWRQNPSLIGDGTYGFVFWQDGKDYGSFPSGHMARMAALAAVVWNAWPKVRWLGVVALLATAIGLLGMNYHFVGDVVFGTALGWVVGAWCCFWSGGTRPVLPQLD